MWLSDNGNADNTKKRYIRALSLFETFYKEKYHTAVNPQNLTAGVLQEYKNYLMNVSPRYSDSTINNYLDCLKPYFNFLIEIGVLDRSPATRVKNIKIQQGKQVRWLTDEEETDLCFLVDNSEDLWSSEWLFHRNRTAFYFMLLAGLRISEVVALEMDDIKNGFIHVRHSKGEKSRTVYMTKSLAKIFNEYLPYREKRILEGKVKEKHAVFFGERGNKFTTSGLDKVVTKLAEKSRIKDLTAHTLRHTLAHNMIKTGATLNEVADVLGHDSIQTTSIYTAASKGEQANAIERATCR